MEQISNYLANWKKEGGINIPQQFELPDELWRLGFSVGLSLEARKESITRFISRWANDLPRLKEIIAKIEDDPSIQNKGAYLRKAMENNN